MRPTLPILTPALDGSEATLEAQLVELATLHGWLAYHTHDSRRSVAGFPDWILIRNDQLLAVELKSSAGKVSEEQYRWLRAFASVRYVASMIIRPAATLDELEKLLT